MTFARTSSGSVSRNATVDMSRPQRSRNPITCGSQLRAAFRDGTGALATAASAKLPPAAGAPLMLAASAKPATVGARAAWLPLARAVAGQAAGALASCPACAIAFFTKACKRPATFPSFVPLGSKSVRQIICASSGRLFTKATEAWSKPKDLAQVWRTKPSKRPHTLPSLVPLPSKPARTWSRTGSGSDCRKCTVRVSRPQACEKRSATDSTVSMLWLLAHWPCETAAACLYVSC
mmetsp:Transcript_1513/g.4701  ORF Transcript_1513/g.4701 Transcript_1513/m.4701 type:complete len:235 (+) Transcript_1513:218-922(+)